MNFLNSINIAISTTAFASVYNSGLPTVGYGYTTRGYFVQEVQRKLNFIGQMIQLYLKF
ncbi:hypothetical protein [Clostridium sp. HBUAS56017]|uniref:hypothetical protein n=1 Tax=Clostridium sp. HBUAS56017 TaxID=2571128 RepID=UPI00163DDF03|nr:hypothetical protein [Clostridium sp. HBUAS56017]